MSLHENELLVLKEEIECQGKKVSNNSLQYSAKTPNTAAYTNDLSKYIKDFAKLKVIEEKNSFTSSSSHSLTDSMISKSERMNGYSRMNLNQKHQAKVPYEMPQEQIKARAKKESCQTVSYKKLMLRKFRVQSRSFQDIPNIIISPIE